jgi:hypothetical protein
VVAEAQLTMGRRTTVFLLVLVLGLGAYIWLVERRAPSVDDERAAARRAVRFDPATVRRVTVLSGGNEVTAELDGTTWSLIRPVAARADAGQIQALIDELAALERAAFITARERRDQKLTDEVYGLDFPRARVLLEAAGGPVAVRIGGDVPVGGMLFLQREGQEDVVVVPTNLLAALPRAASDWRDRRLLSAPAGPLARLEVRRSDGFLQLARAPGGEWRLQKPVSGRADGAAVEAWLQSLFAVAVEDFVADSVAGAALYGLDEPQAQAVLTGSGTDGEQVLLIGREVAGDAGRVYASLRGTESVYAVSTSVLEVLRIPLERFRDRRVLPWPPAALRYLELVQGERRVALSSTNGADWELVGPPRTPAEGPLVWSLLSSWAGARIGSFQDDQSTNLAAWGLAKPLAMVTLSTSAEPGTNAVESGEALALHLGRAGGTGEVYALDLATRSVWQVPAALLGLVRAEPRHFRIRPAFTLNATEVRTVEFSAGDRMLTWTRTGTNGESWVAQPVQRIERGEPEAWLDLAGRLRAVEWVADDPAALSEFGLAPPAARITLGLTGESGLAKVLLLGGAARPGLVHAMVKGQDAVFTLEEAGRDKLLAPLYKAPEPHVGTQPQPRPAEPAAP